MKTQPPRFLSALGPPFCQLLTCDPRFKCVLPRAQEKWLLLAAFHVGSDSSGCGPPTAAVQWVHLQTLLPLPHATSTPPTTTAPALPGPVPVDLWQSESQLTSTGEWMTPGSHSTGGRAGCGFPRVVASFMGFGGDPASPGGNSGICGYCAQQPSCEAFSELALGYFQWRKFLRQPGSGWLLPPHCISAECGAGQGGASALHLHPARAVHLALQRLVDPVAGSVRRTELSSNKARWFSLPWAQH